MTGTIRKLTPGHAPSEVVRGRHDFVDRVDGQPISARRYACPVTTPVLAAEVFGSTATSPRAAPAARRSQTVLQLPPSPQRHGSNRGEEAESL